MPYTDILLLNLWKLTGNVSVKNTFIDLQQVYPDCIIVFIALSKLIAWQYCSDSVREAHYHLVNASCIWKRLIWRAYILLIRLADSLFLYFNRFKSCYSKSSNATDWLLPVSCTTTPGICNCWRNKPDRYCTRYHILSVPALIHIQLLLNQLQLHGFVPFKPTNASLRTV